MNNPADETQHVAEVISALDSLFATTPFTLNTCMNHRRWSADMPEPGNLRDNVSLIKVAHYKLTHGGVEKALELLAALRQHIDRTRDSKGAGILLGLLREIAREVLAYA